MWGFSTSLTIWTTIRAHHLTPTLQPLPVFVTIWSITVIIKTTWTTSTMPTTLHPITLIFIIPTPTISTRTKPTGLCSRQSFVQLSRRQDFVLTTTNANLLMDWTSWSQHQNRGNGRLRCAKTGPKRDIADMARGVVINMEKMMTDLPLIHYFHHMSF